MNISIIGSGYVGLVTGTCFAEVGHQVICMDNDAKKISNLKKGIIPIWEPGLQEMLTRNSEQGRLSFTDDMSHAVDNSDIIFIAVGTPSEEDGSADLRHVLAVAESIAQCMQSEKIIVDKSTVPVGTADKVSALIKKTLAKRGVDINYKVVSNPEFLKEGAAIDDFMRPDRVVIGTDDEDAAMKMRRLYAPFNFSSDRMIVMGVRAAEMTKYAANAMLATKISFMNEIASLCEKYGADVSEVRVGIGSDKRIGYHFIYPGAGYGGSCFPKDVKALIHMAEEVGIEPLIVRSVEERNARQKRVLFEKIVRRFGDDLSGYTFAIWGLSFKPQTDDMREAPSIVIINELIAAGAKVKAYDPVAADVARGIFKGLDNLEIIDDQYAICEDADALVMITEWLPFRSPNFDELKRLLKRQIIFDGRNQYDYAMMKEYGFEYYGIGRGDSLE